VRHFWLTSHLLADPSGAAADRRVRALGAAPRERILATGDRLGGTSALLAQRYYRSAASAWEAFGADGFARWVALGEGLALGEPPCREAALAFFAVPPRALGPRGVLGAAEWCGLARELAVLSRRLAATFLERTGTVLAASDAPARLAAWAAGARRLHAGGGWRGEFLAQAYLGAAPAALDVLGPADCGPWTEIALALGPEVSERDFFAALPAGLERFDAAARASLFAVVLTLAAGSRRHAWSVYRELPTALADLPAPLVREVLGIFACLRAESAIPAAELAPVVGAIVRTLAPELREGALGMVAEVAARTPRAALAALRVLPRCYETASPGQVARWFATGGTLVAEDGPIAEAYFGLVSRTSVRVLAADSTAAVLEECQGLWRKLVQMLSGEAVTVRAVEGLSLRPPLEERPEEHGVALPSRVDCLPTHEENLRVYRALAGLLAARREFGTYAFASKADRPAVSPGGALVAHLRAAADPALLEDVFLVAEGVRVHHRLVAAYPGLGADAGWVLRRLLGQWWAEDAVPRSVALDALLAVAITGRPAEGSFPPWLSAEAVALVTQLLRPLAAPEATVEDAMRVAEALAGAIALPAPAPAVAEADLLFLDDLAGLEPLEPASEGDAGAATPQRGSEGTTPPEGARLALDPPDDAATPSGSRPLSLDELRRLIEAGARIEQATGEALDGPGLSITDLLGKVPSAVLEQLRQALADDDESPRQPIRPARESGPEGPCFFYDEWDHGLGDYRSRWCRLHEVGLEGDSGEFWSTTLTDYARFVPEVRRQFQRLRPEMYRTIRGLEDGEDFDLGAVIDARIAVRARRPPSTKLYRARVREVRDVATLFLLDMSASTDEPLESPTPGRPPRRIIDVTKEALVIMAEALEELGDAYAIYGFSGQGRDNVEFYPVKAFSETLGPTVKARIGGITPRRSTRMGAALRHAVEKMGGVGARVKHLILLSDGFPQDHDYGDDRRSHAYGIRDTAVALREADVAGITPFCITVDRAGHDYLREMCDDSRYAVIEDTAALPRELPRIYQRVVRA
jgi:nitric oxide reductase NorD protein